MNNLRIVQDLYDAFGSQPAPLPALALLTWTSRSRTPRERAGLPHNSLHRPRCSGARPAFGYWGTAGAIRPSSDALPEAASAPAPAALLPAPQSLQVQALPPRGLAPLGRQKWEVFGVEVCKCNWLFSSLATVSPRRLIDHLFDRLGRGAKRVAALTRSAHRTSHIPRTWPNNGRGFDSRRLHQINLESGVCADADGAGRDRQRLLDVLMAAVKLMLKEPRFEAFPPHPCRPLAGAGLSADRPRGSSPLGRARR